MMKTRIVTILLSVLISSLNAAVSLQINGTEYDSIALKPGQAVTVEVVSNDTSAYNVYVGFATIYSALGTFTHLATLTEAGNLASVAVVTPPPVWGFYASAGGASPAPSAGVHFQFTYTPNTVGTTTLYLYASDASTLLDSIAITIEPSELGSGFTYQGRLIDDNQAPDGEYDFEFKLYNAPSEGSQLGSTNTVEDAEVIDGYFISELDFGLSPYNGNSVWLEVGVRPGDSTGAYTVLNPRQRLTSTPNASFATISDWNNLLNMPAGFADGVDNDTTLTESQVESYVANDVTTGYVPYDNGTKLTTSGLYYSGSRFGIGTTSGSGKFNVYTDTDNYGVYATCAYSSNVRYGVYGLASGDSTYAGYGVLGTSNNTIGNNFGVYGSAPANSTGTNYGIYGYASNGGTGDSYAGYFGGDLLTTGEFTANGNSNLAPDGDDNVAIGTSVNSDRKLNVYTDTDTYGTYSTNANTSSNHFGIYGLASGDSSHSGYGVYGTSNNTTGNNVGIYGHVTVSSTGENYGVYGYASNAGSGDAYAGYFNGDVYVTGNVSAASFTDRTPYPKDLETAVDAVMSMSPLPDGQYQADNKEHQLDHSTLSSFIRSEDSKRDLSATVSCHNEVLKDLLAKQQELMDAREMINQLRLQVNSLKQETQKIDQLERENREFKEKLLSIETLLNKTAQ